MPGRRGLYSRDIPGNLASGRRAPMQRVPASRYNPFRYITSARRAIIRSHVRRPAVHGVIQDHDVRCRPCGRAYWALAQLCKRDEKLRVIYVEYLQNDRKSRRAFVVRSHAVRPGNLWCWIKKELQSMPSERNSLKRVPHPDFPDLLVGDVGVSIRLRG